MNSSSFPRINDTAEITCQHLATGTLQIMCVVVHDSLERHLLYNCFALHSNLSLLITLAVKLATVKQTKFFIVKKACSCVFSKSPSVFHSAYNATRRLWNKNVWAWHIVRAAAVTMYEHYSREVPVVKIFGTVHVAQTQHHHLGYFFQYMANFKFYNC